LRVRRTFPYFERYEIVRRNTKLKLELRASKFHWKYPAKEKEGLEQQYIQVIYVTDGHFSSTTEQLYVASKIKRILPPIQIDIDMLQEGSLKITEQMESPKILAMVLLSSLASANTTKRGILAVYTKYFENKNKDKDYDAGLFATLTDELVSHMVLCKKAMDVLGNFYIYKVAIKPLQDAFKTIVRQMNLLPLPKNLI